MTTPTEPMVRADGTYPTVDLRKPVTFATVVQTRVHGVDGANPGPGLRSNLDYFLEAIDIAQGYGGRSDLLLFHDHRLLRLDPRAALPHRHRGAGTGSRRSGQEGEAAQLLHRLRHLRP